MYFINVALLRSSLQLNASTYSATDNVVLNNDINDSTNLVIMQGLNDDFSKNEAKQCHHHHTKNHGPKQTSCEK